MNNHEKKSKWTNCRVAYRGNRIDLIVAPVLSQKAAMEKEIILHPGSAVILPLMAHDKIVMIRNQRMAVHERLLELPAGTMDPPESPEACAKRELEEETGFRAGALIHLGSFYSAPGYCDEMLHAFLASDLETVGQFLELDEDICVEYYHLSEIREMIRSGEIKDAKTISTFFLYFERFGFYPDDVQKRNP